MARLCNTKPEELNGRGSALSGVQTGTHTPRVAEVHLLSPGRP